MRSKTCRTCGREFTRRPNEHHGNYNKRQACSPECARPLMASKQRTIITTDRACQHCGETLTQRPRERPHAFNLRRYCNHDCYTAMKTAAATERAKRDANITCRHCHAPIQRRARESIRDWTRRRACSEACKEKLAIAKREKRNSERRARAKAARPTAQRLDPRPAGTPMKRWEPPERAPINAPDPVPTRIARTPPRPPQALTRAFRQTIELHPELLQAITDPAFGLHIAGPNNGTGYGVGIRKARDKHRRTHA